MQKIYLLLRNNKQTGPYTLDELIRLQLRPLDLIWIEGKSKGWAYPTEIESLREHIKEEQKGKAQETGYIESSPDIVLPKPGRKSQAGDKQASHAKVYVKLPSHYDLSREVSDTLNQKLNDPLDYEVRKREPADEQLNTKYVRDLDDIREQYSEWIYHQKTSAKSSIPVQRIWVAVVVVILLITGFLAQKWTTPAKNTTGTIPVDSVAIVKKPVPSDKNKTGRNKKNNRTAHKNKKEEPAVKTSAKTIKNEKSPDKQTAPGQAESKTAGESPSLEIFKQVDIQFTRDSSNKDGLTGIHFTIHNRSDFRLTAVGVNVYYHQSAQAPLKETIYFNNVLPGGTMTTSAPDHHKASSVTYKLSLISTDERIFYGKE